jgi:hypothetical protein
MASTDLVTCGKFDASQTAQDAAISALQTGGGVTPAAVAGAVNAMTPAQLVAICAKLNCQPTAAALTAALLSLAGSGTAGNVLTIVGGAPVWQAPVAGVASSVPASGIGAGALPAGVTTTPASVVGFDTAVISAVPSSTDSILGKSRSATQAESLAGAANDGIHISPADLLYALSNAGAVQSAVTLNQSQYGTAAQTVALGESAPTAAPTAATPATKLVNTNGEVFDWDGTAWRLSASPYTNSTSGATLGVPTGSAGADIVFICPRAGIVNFAATCKGLFSGGTAGVSGYISIVKLDNVFIARGDAVNTGQNSFCGGSRLLVVTAGQVITAGLYNASSSGITLDSQTTLDIVYIK